MTHNKDKQGDEPQRRCHTHTPRSSVSSRSQQLCHAVVVVGWATGPIAVILPHHPHIMLRAISTHTLRTHCEAAGITPSRRLPPV